MSRVVVNQVGWQGVEFGSALAMAISFHVNESIGWAILHGILHGGSDSGEERGYFVNYWSVNCVGRALTLPVCYKIITNNS